MLIYEGIFFDKDTIKLIHSLEENQLEKADELLHCTFKFRPKPNEIFNDIVGKEFELFLIGYANDGKNSGFEISLPDELKKYYINYEEDNPKQLKTPHITASFAYNAKPKDTKNLAFKPLKEPIKITGKFGYFIGTRQNSYLSFKPYFKKNTY